MKQRNIMSNYKKRRVINNGYTRVNWEDLPSTNTPINATNLNKMDEGIKDLENDITNLENNITNNYVKKTRYDGTSLDGFKDWLVNTATNGSYLMTLDLNGAVSCAIVQKANVNYLSFIHFSYGITAKQYKYNNGTWTEVSL